MLKIFAVRDVKADAFGSLICVSTSGLANRAFVDACSPVDSPMAQYPADYSLYELGTFDPNSGHLTAHKTPLYISSAVEARTPRAQTAAAEPMFPVEVSK